MSDRATPARRAALVLSLMLSLAAPTAAPAHDVKTPAGHLREKPVHHDAVTEVRLNTRTGLRAAATAPAGAASGDDLNGLLNASLDAWAAAQTESGAYPDYARPGCAGRCGGYDEAMLGYAMLLNGLRTGDQHQLDASFKAIAWTASQEHKPWSVFETFAMASAHNLARTQLPDDPRFQAVRGQWENWLRAAPVLRLHRSRYSNQVLVDAVAMLELDRSGLTSDIPGSLLADRAGNVARAAALINRAIPQIARRFTTGPRGARLTVLSDPPSNPIAYHGLTAGFLARGIELLGARASASAHATLAKMARASAHIAAPDGDLAWSGRSQEQAWVLPLSAYAALGARTEHALPLADAAVNRLVSLHRGGPHGFAITPTLAAGADGADLPVDLGIDWYASTAAYTGLTTMGANWMAERLEAARPSRGQRLPAGRNGATTLSRGGGSFATVRRGDSWYAVRLAAAGDLRMDFGVAAWKTRDVAGTWSDRLPLRPVGRGGAGPYLVRHGRSAAAHAELLAVTRRGVVTLKGGGFKAGRRYLQMTRFVVTPAANHLRYEFSARRGDHVLYSVFLPAVSSITPTPRGLTSSRLRVEANHPATLTIDGRYASGREAGLVKATLDLAVQHSGAVQIRLVRPGTAIKPPPVRVDNPRRRDLRRARAQRTDPGGADPRRTATARESDSDPGRQRGPVLE
jgi:hypothetical protein